MMVFCNLSPIISYRNVKKDIIEDFVHPRNDTNTIFNQSIQFFYLQRPVISQSFGFFFRILQLSMSYGPIVSALEIRRDWRTIWENQGKFCDENEKHSAIIIGVYNRFAQSGLLGCGISSLIEWFNAKDVKYRVYFINNRREFFDIVNNAAITNVLIFSHGWHGGMRTSDGNCPYCDLISKMCPEALMKEGVYQFHCNPGNDLSLVELLSVKRGFVNHRINKPEGIKEIIRILIEEKRMNELLILN